MARLRPGVPMMYIRSAIGTSPYNTKVTMAPSKVPVVLVASATAIIRTTYSQPIAIRYTVGEEQNLSRRNMVLPHLGLTRPTTRKQETRYAF